MAARTYWVGIESVIQRSDDLGASWQNLDSIFQSLYGLRALNDVMTDPTNKDKVWVVGSAQNPNSGGPRPLPPAQPFLGIAYSTTGGLTPTGPGQAWYTPGMPAGIQYPNNIKEVWVTDSDTVYACGGRGQVFKSTNANSLSPSFSLTTQILTTPQENCYSLHFPTVNDGVVGLETVIHYTADGGTTWTSADPVGLNAINGRYFEGIYYDPTPGQTFIVAVCNNSVVRWAFDSASSTYKFKRTHCFGIQQSQNCATTTSDPAGLGRHLTWHLDYLGNLHMWATGNNDQIVYSSDKGITWTTVNNHWFKPDVTIGNPTFYPDYAAAHFYLANEGFYGFYDTPFIGSSAAIVQKTVNNVESVSQTNSNSNTKGINAIWTFYEPEPVYRLDDCQGTYVTIYTQSTSVAPYVGQTVYSPTITNPQGITQTPKKCFTVSVSTPTQNLSVVTLPQDPCVWNNCEDCLPKCYILTNCDDENDVRVIQIGACNPNAEELELGIYQTISSPEYCDGICFKLEPCTCDEGACEGPYETFPDYLIQIERFTTCRQCKGIPEVADLRPRSVKPGFYTPGCPPDYTVKTSCMYAEQVYDEMVAVRYGISICCDHDVNRWDIKMQLLQLAAIYDPDLCNPPTAPTDPCENV